MNNYFLVSSHCPIGCGMGVVVLEKVGATQLVYYCHSCGTVWYDPKSTRWGSTGDWDVLDLKSQAPAGVTLPMEATLKDQGIDDWIVGQVNQEAWWATVDEINQSIGVEPFRGNPEGLG